MNALDAAVAVAREHGVRADEPRVLKDAHNLVVHLAPSPVVARVGRKMTELRPHIKQRELELTLWLLEPRPRRTRRRGAESSARALTPERCSGPRGGRP